MDNQSNRHHLAILIVSVGAQIVLRSTFFFHKGLKLRWLARYGTGGWN
jgi:hypothetical protein